jgi:NADH-quinone oxidoreductase subunit D
MDFTVPTGTRGDNYDRFMVRMAGARAEHAHHRAGARSDPDGPIRIEDPRFFLPHKHEVYGSIEA